MIARWVTRHIPHPTILINFRKDLDSCADTWQSFLVTHARTYTHTNARARMHTRTHTHTCTHTHMHTHMRACTRTCTHTIHTRTHTYMHTHTQYTHAGTRILSMISPSIIITGHEHGMYHPNHSMAIPDAQYSQPVDAVNNHKHVSYINFHTVLIVHSYRLIIKISSVVTQRSMHLWIRLYLG